MKNDWKTGNITNFVMLFQAVMKFFVQTCLDQNFTQKGKGLLSQRKWSERCENGKVTQGTKSKVMSCELFHPRSSESCWTIVVGNARSCWIQKNFKRNPRLCIWRPKLDMLMLSSKSIWFSYWNTENTRNAMLVLKFKREKSAYKATTR
jgi:hypothetical protein